MSRKKMKKRKDQKIFKKTAKSVEKHNIIQNVPRGGYRL